MYLAVDVYRVEAHVGQLGAQLLIQRRNHLQQKLAWVAASGIWQDCVLRLHHQGVLLRQKGSAARFWWHCWLHHLAGAAPASGELDDGQGVGLCSAIDCLKPFFTRLQLNNSARD